MKSLTKIILGAGILILSSGIFGSCSMKDIKKRDDHYQKKSIAVNNPPQITSTQITETNCGYFSDQIIAEDQDNDSLEYSLTQPDWALISPYTGYITGSILCLPEDTVYPFTANVSDGKDSVSKSWDLLVKGTGESPEITPDPVNQAPTTTISKDFGDGLSGEVNYSISATDSEGYVDAVDIYISGNPFAEVQNSTQVNPFIFYMDVPIMSGTNNFQAISTDNEGLKESNPPTSSFVSPTEAEARTTIEGILDAWGGTYYKDYILNFTANSDSLCPYPGQELSIPVDYLVISDGKGATINYTSFDDNLSTDLDNYDALRYCGITDNDLQMSRLPLNEIDSRTNTFADNGFMN